MTFGVVEWLDYRQGARAAQTGGRAGEKAAYAFSATAM
jgi:hypothetical protein